MAHEKAQNLAQSRPNTTTGRAVKPSTPNSPGQLPSSRHLAAGPRPASPFVRQLRRTNLAPAFLFYHANSIGFFFTWKVPSPCTLLATSSHASLCAWPWPRFCPVCRLFPKLASPALLTWPVKWLFLLMPTCMDLQLQLLPLLPSSAFSFSSHVLQ